MTSFTVLRALDDVGLLRALRALYAPGAPVPDVVELTRALRGRELAVPVPGGAVRLDLGDWTSILLVRLGAWEPHLVTLARRLVRAGDVAIDAGAHVGTWTLLLASLVGPGGQVVAYEPLPASAARARAAVPGATVIEAALGDHEGHARLHAYAGGSRFEGPDPMLRSLWRSEGYGDEGALDVRVTTLDAADLPRVDFLKIDVEGSELAVLRGARALLARSPAPRLLVELHAEELAIAGASIADVTDELAAQGLAVMNVVPDGGRLLVRPLARAEAPRTHHIVALRDDAPFEVELS